jgi:tRNA-dihydrouridine synthase 1
MTMTTGEEKKEDSPPRIPVDRQWISKLLKKYPNPNARRNDKALVVAPMVDQSDLPFRLLCRQYGANLCVTPMIHSRLLCESPQYRKKFLGDCTFPVKHDRPLIAQLCGSDPEIVLKAARWLEPHVDGIDINCGCPQGIARRGNYGAYLLEQEETLLTLVRHLVQHLTVPLSVKVRLLPVPAEDPSTSTPSTTIDTTTPAFDIPQASLDLYTKLVDAGIHLLTIHGRTRHEKGNQIGHADWKTIRRAVDLLGDRIPIFANGSLESYEDIEECLRITNADGVMSSESLLEFPPIFYKIPQTPVRTIGRLQLAKEYMALAKEYPPNKGGQGSGLKCIRIHVHRFLHADLQADPTLRQQLVSAESVEALEAAIQDCERYHQDDGHQVCEEGLSWYLRHRGDAEELKERMEQNSDIKIVELAEDSAECFASLFGDDE